MDPVGARSSDPIADALTALRVRSSIFCLSELTAPWGFSVHGAPMSKFHLVLSGAGWLTLAGEEPVLLRDGDLVLLPRGQAHTMRDEPGTDVIALDRLIAEHSVDGGSRISYGGSGEVTRVLCGAFSLDDEQRVLPLLPEVLRVDAESVAMSTWLAPMLSSLETEAAGGDQGSSAIQAKIADVFVAQALRAWLTASDRAGVLPVAVLSDDAAVAEAISLVRQRLAAPWTVDRLAAHAGLSRTVFISRFRRSVGESPMRYVTRLRLSAAAGLLSTTRLSLLDIAAATGYQNDSSLSKAFSREFGRAPGSFRAGLRAPVADAS